MIAPITGVIPLPVAPALTAPGGTSDEFRNLLADSIGAVQQKQNDAQTAVNQFLTGETEELHSAAIAGQRAELSRTFHAGEK